MKKWKMASLILLFQGASFYLGMVPSEHYIEGLNQKSQTERRYVPDFFRLPTEEEWSAMALLPSGKDGHPFWICDPKLYHEERNDQ